MKTLFLSALIAAVSIVGHPRKAHAASVQQLCVNGKVTSTSTPAQGPNIAVTSCQWASGTTINTDASTAKSIAVSGGTTLGTITINVGTAVNPMAISITNGFTTKFNAALKGQLPAGSSVTVKDCSFTVPTAYGVDFRTLTLAGSDFVFSSNLVTITANVRMMQLPSCSGKCALTIDDNVFNYTTGGQFGVLIATAAHSVTFVSRRNLFLAPSGFNGYRISPPTSVSSPPANWSLVTEQEARDVYGKSTYVFADNVFENFSRPLSIADPDGADITIENNTIRNSGSPDYTYTGNNYRLQTVIRNNTLTFADTQTASLEITINTLPAFSSVLIQNNTLTHEKGSNPRIVRLLGPTIYNDAALLEISGNVLLLPNRSTGLLNGVYSIYSTVAYTTSQVALIAASAPLMVFGNTLFGVPINTYELTFSTVFFANRSRMLKINSPYPEPTTTTTTAAPTTTTVAPTTTTAAPTTTTVAPTTTTVAPTTTTAALSTSTVAPTTTTSTPTTNTAATTTVAPTTTTVAPTTTVAVSTTTTTHAHNHAVLVFGRSPPVSSEHLDICRHFRRVHPFCSYYITINTMFGG